MTNVSTRPEMPTTTLGRIGITTSRLGVGAWGFADASNPRARVGDDDDVLRGILQTAFDAGVRFIDSAEIYACEARLNRVFSTMKVPDDVLIATKFGHGKGFSAGQFRAAVEQSLADLNLQKLPIMKIHDPRTEEDMADILGPNGALSELRKMQDEGLVGHIGVATGTYTPLRLAVESGEFDCIEFPRLYTLLNPAARTTGLLEAAKAKDMATLSASPFAGNILAAGSAPDATYAFRPPLPEVLDAVRRMESAAAELGATMPSAALAFGLTDPLIDVTIFGVVTEAELRADLEALRRNLTRAEVEKIAEAGQIDPELLGAPEFLKPMPADREAPPVKG
jgi:D-threo-aldose 1-dehydrogenase